MRQRIRSCEPGRSLSRPPPFRPSALPVPSLPQLDDCFHCRVLGRRDGGTGRRPTRPGVPPSQYFGRNLRAPLAPPPARRTPPGGAVLAPGPHGDGRRGVRLASAHPLSRGVTLGIPRDTLRTRETLGVRRDALGVRRDALGVRRDALGVRRDALGIRRASLKRFDVVEPLASDRSAFEETLSVFEETLSAFEETLSVFEETLSVFEETLSVFEEMLSAFGGRRCKRFDDVEPLPSRPLGTRRVTLGVRRDALGIRRAALQEVRRRGTSRIARLEHASERRSRRSKRRSRHSESGAARGSTSWNLSHRTGSALFGEMLSALEETLSAFGERRCKRFDVVEPLASRRSARVE